MEEKKNFKNINNSDKMNLPKNKYFYNVADIMKLNNCSKRKAYRIIGDLNKELAKKGILIDRGNVSVKYYHERYNI